MRTLLSLAFAAVLVACSDVTTPGANATATGFWSASVVPGTQLSNVQMQLTESGSGAITGNVSYTLGGGGGAGGQQLSGSVQGTRQGSTVSFSWNVAADPHTFAGTLNGNVLTGSLTYGQGAVQVTFER